MWDLIKQICKDKNITLNQLCENLGVSYQSLFITIKQRDMRISTLKRIASALGVAPSVLLDHDKDATATPDNTTATTAPSNQITCPVCHSVLTFSVADDATATPGE